MALEARAKAEASKLNPTSFLLFQVLSLKVHVPSIHFGLEEPKYILFAWTLRVCYYMLTRAVSYISGCGRVEACRP